VSRPLLKIGTEQPAEVFEQYRGRGRVQPVTAVIDPYAGHLEGGRKPTQDRRALDETHRPAGQCRPPRRGQTGRPTAEHDDVAFVRRFGSGHLATVGPLLLQEWGLFVLSLT